MNPKEEIKNRIGHLKEVETLLLRGKEEGLLREVRSIIYKCEKELERGIPFSTSQRAI